MALRFITNTRIVREDFNGLDLEFWWVDRFEPHAKVLQERGVGLHLGGLQTDALKETRETCCS